MKISEYVNREHRLSRVDPRVKIFVTVAALVMVLSYQGFAFQILVAASCLALCRGMKVPGRIILLRFSEPLFIVAVILALKLFFTGSEVLFSFPLMGMEIAGYRDGLVEGLTIGIRILAAIAVVAVLVFSTSFTELVAALSWFRVPRGFVEVLLHAYRYIFVLLEEAGVIYSAQKNRLGYSSFKRGLSSFGVLTGSLLLKAFEHSQNVTLAMMQRGYEGHIPLLRQKPFRPAEIALSLLLVTAMGIAWTI
jgi:cobalt/nickel transport system permease protein